MTTLESVSSSPHSPPPMRSVVECESVAAAAPAATESGWQRTLRHALARVHPLTIIDEVMRAADAASAGGEVAGDTCARLQCVFDESLIPSVTAALQVHRHRAAGQVAPVAPAAPSIDDSSAGGHFGSLTSLIYTHLMPLYFAPSNPFSARNLSSLYHCIQQCDVRTMESARTDVLPTLFAFLVEYMHPLAGVMREAGESVPFFHSLLVFASVGLCDCDGDPLMVKLSLAMLRKRAELLYSEEEDTQERPDKRRPGKRLLAGTAYEAARGNRHQQARELSAAVVQATSDADAAAVSTRRVQRHTPFPDYALATWRLYEHLFQVVMNNYELHLVKHDFPAHIECLLREHERHYRHTDRENQQAANRDGGDHSHPFTPDVFLELLFRFALAHSNPYVRKYIIATVLVTLRERVRWGPEMLFGESTDAHTSGVARPRPIPLLQLVSTAALLPLLPSPAAIDTFWQCQFDLLRTTEERRQFLMRFLRTLAYHHQQGQAATAHLNLHLTFLAHVRCDDPAALMLPSAEMMPCLYALARSIPIAVHASTTSVHQLALYDSLAIVFLRCSPLARGGSLGDVAAADQLRELAQAIVTLVPDHMQRRTHSFHRQLAQRWCVQTRPTSGAHAACATSAMPQLTRSSLLLLCRLCSHSGEWMSRTLRAMVDEFLCGVHRSAASSESILVGARHLAALCHLLPVADPHLATIATRICTAMTDAIAAQSIEHMQRSAELMLAMLHQVAVDRLAHSTRSAVAPSAHFRRTMETMRRDDHCRDDDASVFPPTIGADVAPFDRLLGDFFSSGGGLDFLSLLRAQMTQTATGAEATATTAMAAAVHLRGVVIAIMSQMTKLYPTPTPHLREIAQTCLARLLSTSAPLAPMAEAHTLYSLQSVVHACHTGVAPSSVSHLMSPAHFLSLVSHLAHSTLPQRIAAHRPTDSRIDESAVMRANHVRNAQVSRWRLMRTLLHSASHAIRLESHSPLLVSHATDPFAAAIIQQSPRIVTEIILPAVADAIDGSTAEYWPLMVDCITSCIDLCHDLSQRSQRILADDTDSDASASASRRDLLVAWSTAHARLDLHHLFACVWRSFQDLVGSKWTSGDDDDRHQPNWINWSGRPTMTHSTPPHTDSGAEDHTLPHMHTSLVDLVLHRSFFAGAGASLVSAASPLHTLVRSHLASAVSFAQRRGHRTLLYALTIRCVEVFAAQPRVGVHFLPELATLLTLDRSKSDATADSNSAGRTATMTSAACAPIEQLVRVMIMTLFERLTRDANTAFAPRAHATSHAADAYFFVTHAMHHLVRVHFQHAEHAPERGGSATTDDAASGATPADGMSSSSPSHSASHRAMTAVWHGLCAMATLRMQPAHCVYLSTEWTADATAIVTEAPAAATSAETKKKHKTKSHSQRPSSMVVAPPLPGDVLRDDYPLLQYVQYHTFLSLLSASLPSSVRHLLEIFLINLISGHIDSESHATIVAEWMRAHIERGGQRQNIVCSLIVIAGFVCSKAMHMQFHQQQQQLQQRHSSHALDSASPLSLVLAPLVASLFSQVHICTQSPFGQVRTIAQYFFFSLFVEVYHSHLFPSTAAGRSALPKGMQLQAGLATDNADDTRTVMIEEDPLPLSALTAAAQADALFAVGYYPLFLFLFRSPPIAGLRVRQDAYFRAFRPFSRATVDGLIEYAHAYESAVGEETRDDPNDISESSSLMRADVAVADTGDLASGSVAPPSYLLRIGVELPTEDLLLHLRAATSDFLDAMRDEREFAYYEDRSTRDTASATVTTMTTITGNRHRLAAWTPASSPSLSSAPDGVTADLSSGVALNYQQKIAPLKSLVLETVAATAIRHAADEVTRDDVQTRDNERHSTGSSSASASVGAVMSAASPAPPSRLVPSAHLVLCASLVSNPVNLGGLCRTAEIMTGSLVVSSSRLLSDPAFTNVSSTANRWADIAVVAQEELAHWMRDMRRRGYALVGLEQTIHSQPLQSAQFAPRVVFLLGNERQGIPADLLPLLDACVVIPQFGLIRSLNVHVSAGMLVWEWIKQHIDSNEHGHAHRQPRLTSSKE